MVQPNKSWSPSPLWLLFIAKAVVGAVQTATALGVPLWAVELELRPAIIGITIAIGNAVPLLAALPVGMVLSRIAPRTAILISGIGLVIAPLPAAILPGSVSLMVTAGLYGGFHLIIVVATQAMVASISTPERYERDFGLYTMWLSLGQLIGPLAAGMFIAQGLFTELFICSAFLPILSMLLIMRLPRVTPLPSAKRGAAKMLSRFAVVYTDAPVRTAILVSVVAMLGVGAYQSFFPVLLDTLNLPATSIGILVGIRSLTATLVRPLIPLATSLVASRYWVMMIAVISIGIGIVLTGINGNVVWFAVLSTLVGVGSGITQPLSMVILADRVQADMVTNAFAIRLMANRAAQLIAPLFIGLVAEGSNLQAGFHLLGAVILAAIAGVGLTQYGAKKHHDGARARND